MTIAPVDFPILDPRESPVRLRRLLLHNVTRYASEFGTFIRLTTDSKIEFERTSDVAHIMWQQADRLAEVLASRAGRRLVLWLW